MTKQFTSSEVRQYAKLLCTSLYNLDPLMRTILNDFASLLEAQEKAEPVAWVRQDTIDDENGCPIGMDEPYVCWNAACPDDRSGWSPLYIHPAPHKGATHCDNCGCTWLDDGNNPIGCPYCGPAPSDAERLAEALRFYANPEIYKPHPHGPAFDRRDLSTTARETLAAHSAQAQPPATSVTDAMVWRERVEAAAYILYLQDWCQDEDGPVDFTEAFLSSLRKKWIGGWLPARFEAHCGDCTKVAAPCTRCAVERYLSDAARLLGVPEAALAAQENSNG